jgi:hypothetical protein
MSESIEIFKLNVFAITVHSLTHTYTTYIYEKLKKRGTMMKNSVVLELILQFTVQKWVFPT